MSTYGCETWIIPVFLGRSGMRTAGLSKRSTNLFVFSETLEKYTKSGESDMTILLILALAISGIGDDRKV